MYSIAEVNYCITTFLKHNFDFINMKMFVFLLAIYFRCEFTIQIRTIWGWFGNSHYFIHVSGLKCWFIFIAYSLYIPSTY